MDNTLKEDPRWSVDTDDALTLVSNILQGDDPAPTAMLTIEAAQLAAVHARAVEATRITQRMTLLLGTARGGLVDAVAALSGDWPTESDAQSIQEILHETASPDLPAWATDWNAAKAELRPLKACPSAGASEVAVERQHQIEVEGWSTDHDGDYQEGELIRAAICYAASAARIGPESVQMPGQLMAGAGHLHPWWPWSPEWDKRPPPDAGYADRRKALVKAGALLAAEIDRLDREQVKP